jgi:hypothetical protein
LYVTEFSLEAFGAGERRGELVLNTPIFCGIALVSRFRRSYHFAARAFTNVLFKDNVDIGLRFDF